jgi:glucose/arabinose dehydrogenase
VKIREIRVLVWFHWHQVLLHPIGVAQLKNPCAMLPQIVLLSLVIEVSLLSAQNFTRTELPTQLSTPWEITYGPDNALWITEMGGQVVKVDPVTGDKKIVYKASDYFEGHSSECCANCHKPKIGAGTFGLALHPDFLNPANAYVYFAYSYNSGTSEKPCTKFRIKRIKWDASAQSVSEETNLVDLLPTGYDHWGGRLLAIEQDGQHYLFFSIGDNGVSEENSPGCYIPETTNPNYSAQDPTAKTGKVHRFNMDGSIPADNPLPGNSFYTRGHRNSQGLAYNPTKKIIYEVEHGDRTDDEINILKPGMNYGWKNVRGYHGDGNYPGEQNYISSYAPSQGIVNDALVEPLYAWNAVTQPTGTNNAAWGTVAPSGAHFYDYDGIPEWKNSLLVVTLKNGNTCDQELYRFKLTNDGTALAPSTMNEPNPVKFFGEDQKLNGRLRDLAVSPDGKSIFLINNAGADRDKITVYRWQAPTALTNETFRPFHLELYPNPTTDCLNINCSESVEAVSLYNIFGEQKTPITTNTGLNVSLLPVGTYYLKVKIASGDSFVKKVVKN